MERVYLDNAATTALAPEVLEAMLPVLKSNFGNPSSVHGHGRECKSVVEKARKDIASLLNVSPMEIFFTSGGTEADNLAIRGLIQANKLPHAISSKLEHHAVLHTLEDMEEQGLVKLHFVKHDEKGVIDLFHLQELLEEYPQSLVSIMHANNEVGNINDIEKIGLLCRKYDALFHSDTVQTMGHLPLDLKAIEVDAVVGAAHKFHGPKGVGFLYLRKSTALHPLLTGGSQERNMRGGTENVYGIAGMAKALEISIAEQQEHWSHILGLKNRFVEGLKSNFEDIDLHGTCDDLEGSLYTLVNVGFPPSEINDLLLFNLDLNHISASGGSACSSGSQHGSHVMAALGTEPGRGVARFSFGRYNTVEDVDYVLEKLKELYGKS